MKTNCFSVCFVIVLLISALHALPVEQCSEVCPLEFKLNCATDGRCLKAFSNLCDLLFYNCRYDQNFQSVNEASCKSPSAVLCDDIDRQVVDVYTR